MLHYYVIYSQLNTTHILQCCSHPVHKDLSTIQMIQFCPHPILSYLNTINIPLALCLAYPFTPQHHPDAPTLTLPSFNTIDMLQLHPYTALTPPTCTNSTPTPSIHNSTPSTCSIPFLPHTFTRQHHPHAPTLSPAQQCLHAPTTSPSIHFCRVYCFKARLVKISAVVE